MCVGLLLLYRTLSRLEVGYAPKALQILLGCPYTSYDISQTTEYHNFINTVN